MKKQQLLSYVSDCPLGGARGFRNSLNLSAYLRCVLSVQDVTEVAKTAGDQSQNEDGEDESTSISDPSEEQMQGKAEGIEGKQEAAATKPQRRASTPPPPSLPVKLLTRLGSLEGASSRTHTDVKSAFGI